MTNAPTAKPESADESTSDVPVGTSPTRTLTVRQVGRTALLALLTQAPAPVLVAVVDWWLKTH
ncbi:hypothetical protein ACIRBX_34900 [Kitasatospora sp. NPDC096147]|uniref:hypothetical protein n=1 Tax=Kitasatospora sp. NPDC096147 TaxID=3364093 RepID=UPI0038225184